MNIKVEGTVVCLPHKPGGDISTKECAIGLLASDGMYYALLDLEQEELISGRIGVNDKVRITGEITNVGSDTYDITGIIHVETIEVLGMR